MAVVTVEEVKGRAAYRRFVEFPYLQFRDEARWSAPLAAYERSRLDPHNPFFDLGDGEYFLARKGGVVAGRVTAHVATRNDAAGWFGFFDVVDDERVGVALLERAADWLRNHGCTSVTGPASFTPDDDLGVLVDGFEHAGTTGRAWHPRWYAAHLRAAGLTQGPEQHTWRLPPEPGSAYRPVKGRHASVRRFTDPRLVLEGVVAVPDLTPARGSAVNLARRARRREWEGCTIVELDGEPAPRVSSLRSAAADAGYQWVVSPWAPKKSGPPETTHARFTMAL